MGDGPPAPFVWVGEGPEESMGVSASAVAEGSACVVLGSVAVDVEGGSVGGSSSLSDSGLMCGMSVVVVEG